MLTYLQVESVFDSTVVLSHSTTIQQVYKKIKILLQGLAKALQKLKKDSNSLFSLAMAKQSKPN